MNGRPTKIVLDYDAARHSWKIADGDGNPVGAGDLIGICAELSAIANSAMTLAAITHHAEQVKSSMLAASVLGKRPIH